MASIGIGKAVSWFEVARRAAERSTVTAFMAAAVTLTSPGGSVHAQSAQESGLGPEVDAFITRMTREHQFDGLELRQMFSRFEPNKAILKAIDRPATSRPWSYFRKLYVTPTRVEGGVEFWNEHASWLEKARNKYGVPEEIITSIIGVETIYGRYTGKFHVTDALYTLGFEVPRRSRFFQGQFEHFLLLARENEIDPSSVKGSFAGAMDPRHGGVDQRDVAVGFRAEFGGGAGEQLRLRGDLCVHLHPDHHLPVAGGARNRLRFGFGIGEFGHHGRSHPASAA